MKKITQFLAVTASTLAITSAAHAGGLGIGVALFDEMIPVFGPGQHDMATPGVGSFYDDMGMTISATETLFLGTGNSQGDIGGFSIEGTNGPAFLSLYDPQAGGTVSFTFDNPVDFLVDLITSSCCETDDIVCTVTTMRNGVIVESEILTLSVPTGDPDGQSIFRRYDGADTFHFQLAPNSNRVFAFDWIEWQHRGCGIGDINEDGALNFLDISAYIAEFSQGCPE
tara:strand:+ start:708 stop:1385 length:678 start_codon:yes stop_codon:yes gene_type:complete